MFRSRRDSDWSLTNVGALSGLSLFDHATRLVAEHGDGPLPCGGEPLPDEPPPDPSKLRYGPGVMDGIGAVRAGPGDGQPAVVAASAIFGPAGGSTEHQEGARRGSPAGRGRRPLIV